MLPFALLVLLLFAFALDPDRGVLAEADGRAVLGHGAVHRRAGRPALMGG